MQLVPGKSRHTHAMLTLVVLLGGSGDAGGAAGGPPNDDCANAMPIADGVTPFSTIDATTDGSPHEECVFPPFPGDQIHNDIWYDYVASCTGTLRVSTCNAATFDTKLAIYDGTTCPATAILACNDDAVGCFGFTSIVAALVQCGEAYRIRVGAFFETTGTGTLTLTCEGDPCPDWPTGACCVGAICVPEQTQEVCEAVGTWQGVDSTCNPDPCQADIYVDDDATLGGDGTTWFTAYRYFQDALIGAASGTEIRVAQGTYKPDQDEAGNVTPGERTETFQLISGVELYGGYRGCPGGDCGGGDPDEHDISLYETTLSGDVAGDDEMDRLGAFVACFTGPGGLPQPWCNEFDFDLDGDVDGDDLFALFNSSYNNENSYHVVTGSGANETAVLGGFTITAGNANGSSLPDDAGGGIRTDSGSPTLIHCTFTGNSAHFGGGMENFNGANPTLRRCAFLANRATFRGGGMHNNTSDPMLIECTFSINVAANSGGGMRNSDSINPSLIHCMFLGNSAGFGGGVVNDESDPRLHGCTFSGNTAHGTSGGMHNWHSSPTLTQCTFSGNATGTVGGGMYNASASSSPTLMNCVLWGNIDQGGSDESAQVHGGTPVVRYSCIQGLDGLAGEGNIGSNPLLVDANGADDIAGTADDNLRLSSGSPSIDAADNTAVPADVADLDDDGDTAERTPLDLDGAPRFVDDPDTGDTGVPDPPDYLEVVDMGAYEYQECEDAADCDDGNDCTSDVCEEGGCTHPNSPLGAACGDPSDTDCDNPDTCDGLGMCQANFEADGMPCPDSLYCNGEETCDGAGACRPGAPVLCPQVECEDTCDEQQQSCNTPAGVPCGDPTDSDCDNPDSCDGAGGCRGNNEPDGTPCTDDGDRCTDDICIDKACAHPGWPDDHDNACGACCYASAGQCFDDLLERECRGDVWAVNDFCASRDLTCEKVIIPAISEWGLLVTSVLLLVGMGIKFGRRQARA